MLTLPLSLSLPSPSVVFSSAVMKSHLRLNAARFIIKLTRGRPAYEKMVAVSDYSRLALVVQDPVYRVRHGLASRIMKYLRAKELHIRYLAILLLAAHEPEMEWRQQVQRFLAQQSKNQVVGKCDRHWLMLAPSMEPSLPLSSPLT